MSTSTRTIKKPINAQLGSARVTVIAEDKVTGIAKIYSTAFTPKEGTALPMGTMLTNAKEENKQFNIDGSIAPSTFSNAVTTDRNLSVTFIDDGNYYRERVTVGADKSLLVAMLMAESFKDTNIQKVVGSNGTRLLETVVTDATPASIFRREGRCALPQTDDGTGKNRTEPNNFVTGLATQGLTVIIEIFFQKDNATMQGVRYLYCMPSTQTGTMASSANEKTIECKLYCDTAYIDGFLIDTITAPDVVDTTGADTIYAVEADYLIKTSAPATPTISEVANGAICAVVDTDDGKVHLYKYVTDTWTVSTSTLGVDCRILGKAVGTSLSIKPTTGRAIVAIGTSGTSGNAVAVTNKVETTGSGTADYIFEVRDFDVDTASWVDYNHA